MTTQSPRCKPCIISETILSLLAIYGCQLHVSGNLKWRLPLWLQLLCPGIVCIGGWWLPESPRWLIAKDRREEAHAFIVEYHANGDASHPLVALEMMEIEDSLRDGGIKKPKDYFNLRSLVNTRARRYRFMLMVFMSWFGQFSGNNISSYYLPYMLENVGITSTNLVLLLNAIYALTGWIAATVGGKLRQLDIAKLPCQLTGIPQHAAMIWLADVRC